MNINKLLAKLTFDIAINSSFTGAFCLRRILGCYCFVGQGTYVLFRLWNGTMSKNRIGCLQ
jgi:hypothetical protein